MSDLELLQQYSQTGSQEAFAELVSHHSDWIYSAALRLVRRGDVAEDVTQAVFFLLAQQAGKLKTTSLNAWLFKVTRTCSLNALRGEGRRRNRERQVAMMTEELRGINAEAIWEQVAPILEETVGRLAASDREAVLLRFYQRKSLAEVGLEMGVSEEAARKRVGKAVERLRILMSARGVAIPTVAVGLTILAERITQAAPPGCSAYRTFSASASRISHEVNRMYFVFKLKLLVAILLLAAIPLGLWFMPHGSNAGQITARTPAAFVQPFVANQSIQPAQTPDENLVLAPFYNSRTQIIIAIDLPKIDLNALRDEQQNVLLALTGADVSRRALVERNVGDLYNQLNRISVATSSAGCTHVYMPAWTGGPGPSAGLYVFPVSPQTNMAALDNLMKQPAIETPNGFGRVYGGKRVTALMEQMNSAQGSPDLSEAMSAGPDQAIRIVLLPAILPEIGLRTNAFGFVNFSDPHWRTVKWCRLGLDSSPDLSASIIIQCRDGDSAIAMAQFLRDRFTGLKDVGGKDEVETRIAGLAADLKPAISGDRVTLNLDRPFVEVILADLQWSVIQQGGGN